MTSRLEFDGRFIDSKDASDCAELRQLYEWKNQRKRPGYKYPLWCCNEHRGRMYLWEDRVTQQLWASHYPGQGGDNCRTSIGESAEHRACKDYVVEAVPWPADKEFSLGRKKPRPDVMVAAPNPMGVEVQFTTLNLPAAKGKSTNLMRNGLPPLFIGPNSDRIGVWESWVPTIKFNPDLNWTEGVPPPRSAKAIDLRHIVARRCGAMYFEHCPKLDYGFCGGFHARYEPLDQITRTLDDALIGVGTGELVRHRRWDNRVYVVAAEDLTVYRELEGQDGLFGSTEVAAKILLPEDDGTSRPCRSIRAYEVDEEFVPTDSGLLVPLSTPVCPGCNFSRLLLSLSVERGMCEGCWRKRELEDAVAKHGTEPVVLTDGSIALFDVESQPAQYVSMPGFPDVKPRRLGRSRRTQQTVGQ